jgi:hypothetical protein
VINSFEKFSSKFVDMIKNLQAVEAAAEVENSP